MNDIISTLSYENIRAIFRQQPQGIGIQFQCRDNGSNISITLSYGQCYELVVGINKVLANTDVAKIETKFIGSMANEYKYNDAVTIDKSDELSSLANDLADNSKSNAIARIA